MPSFDIVSEVDIHQATNAVDQANRIVTTRFDFKGVDASFVREDKVVTLSADADFQLEQMQDMLGTTLHKCGIDIACMDVSDIEPLGKHVRMKITLKSGLDSDLTRKIVKLIKAEKMKVQSAIQGEKVRVTGKKRDDLQAVMALLKGSDLDMPLQFDNFRD